MQASRRSLLGAAALLAAPRLGFAQAQEIVLAGAHPLTGVFAFAGQEGFEATRDFIAHTNANGGVAGRQIKYLPEDTGYRVDQSMAVFARLMGQHNNQIPVFFGDSTGFQKAVNPELKRLGTTIMGGASMATEIDDPAAFPFEFMAGPNYSDQVAILLRHVAATKPGAKIAFIHSDTEFGRDPIAHGTAEAQRLGLTIAATLVTPPGSVDVSTEVLRLRRAAPDFAIFHGYVMAPIPEFIGQARQAGMTTIFMNTFYPTDNVILKRMGAAADGMLGVTQLQFMADPNSKGATMDLIRRLNPGKERTTSYLYSWLVGQIAVEALRRVLTAGQQPTAQNTINALRSIKDYDTGGLVGVPVSVVGNSLPVGRIYRANGQTLSYTPASDWIKLR